MKIRHRSSRANMYKLSQKHGGGSSPSRSRSNTSKSSKKPHSPTNNHSHTNSKEKAYQPFKKFYPVDSAVSSDIVTLAVFLEVSSSKNPNIKFYDLVKDNHTFKAFYSFFNKFTKVDKEIFSYVFFALVIQLSNNKSYSFKEYDLMFPELGFSEHEEDISKLLHGLSKNVLQEISESRSHKKHSTSPSRVSSSASRRQRVVVKTGGNSNNRFKKRTMKYNQTGGFWYVIIALLINAGIAMGIPMNYGGRGLRIILLTIVFFWGFLSLYTHVRRILYPDLLFHQQLSNELLPQLTDTFTAAFTSARALVPRDLRNSFDSNTEIARYNATVARIPDDFRSFVVSQRFEAELSFPELIRVYFGNYEIVPERQTRIMRFLTSFTSTHEYGQLQGHLNAAFDAVRSSYSAIVANTPLPYEEPGPREREPFFGWLLSSIRNIAINVGNAQTVAEDAAYNFENSRRIGEFISTRSVSALQEAFRRMSYDLQTFITEASARFGVVVDRQIFGIRQAIMHMVFAAFGIYLNL